MRHLQQTIRYQRHDDAIKILGTALDLLGKHDTAQAIEVLMAYRNHLQDMQIPKLEDYDPRKAQMEAGR